MTIPMIFVALLCIIGGIYPRLTIDILPYNIDTPLYIPSKVVDALVFTVLSGIIFFLGMKKIFNPHKKEIADIDSIYIKLVKKVFAGNRKKGLHWAMALDLNTLGLSIFLTVFTLVLFLLFLFIGKL